MEDLFRQLSTDFEAFKEKRLVFGGGDTPPSSSQKPTQKKTVEKKRTPPPTAKQIKGLPRRTMGLGKAAYGRGVKRVGRLEGRPRPKTQREIDERIAREKIQAMFGSVDTNLFAPAEPEPGKKLSPAEQRKLKQQKKAEALKLQQETEADQAKEEVEALQQEIDEMVEEDKASPERALVDIKKFEDILDQREKSGEYLSVQAYNSYIKSAEMYNRMNKRGSKGVRERIAARRKLKAAMAIFRKGDRFYDKEKYVGAKKVYAKAKIKLEAARDAYTAVIEKHEAVEDKIASALQEAEKPETDYLAEGRREGMSQPEQLKQTVDKLVKAMGYKIVKVKKVDMASAAGKMDKKGASVASRGGKFDQVSYKIKPEYAKQEVVQKAIQELVDRFAFSASILSENMGTDQLGKAYGVVIALKTLGEDLDADHLMRALKDAADEWEEGRSGGPAIKGAFADYMDVSVEPLYAGGRR